ncbi:DUF6636 domain-containing protein [Nocardia cyriacigeorgica]|uniref:DUF6636 domain-containing protein n=1 Tax=Nocardia cyriacigeorgica TaxID=135487 RepID=UPI0024548940|nr:DUF6636 domain-containing protein [Nocardia cyriacigeorgica]
MKRVFLASLAVLVAFGMSGCAQDSSPPSADANSAVSTAPERPITPGTPEPAPPAIASGEPNPGQPPTGEAVPPTTLPSRDDATVDARDFQQGNHYYFQSPTGNIMCGFINEGELGTGCQLRTTQVVPPELTDCDTSREDRALAAQVVGGAARFMCVNQGFFVGSPTDGTRKGGGNVLEYGETIIVRGTACTSMPTGIRCDQAGHGFMIAADAQSLF